MELSGSSPEPSGNKAAGSEDAPPGTTDSVTGTGEGPNPFWSERAVEEFRLQRARPLGLAEFDDRQLEPEYGSEAGRSIGFASARANSARAASPGPARGSEVSSEARLSGVVSNAPSVTSRSRSPTREEMPGVRELLVTVGNAVAGLAEEQRNAQRRLSVVEETRSGSTSTMRTGREGAEIDSGQIGVGEGSVGPQFFQIGEGDLGESRESRSGMLALEDWVQTPVRLDDIPRDVSLVGPVGAPASYGPTWFGDDSRFELTSQNVGGAPGLSALPSAQVRGFEGPVHRPGLEVQQGALPSAQVRGFEGPVHRSGLEVQQSALPSAQVRGFEGSVRRSGLEVQRSEESIGALPSAQVRGFEGSVHRTGLEESIGALPSAQVRGFEGSVHYSGRNPPMGAALSAQAGVGRTRDEGATRHPPGALGLGSMELGMHPGQSFTVWVDGIPRVAMVGPRGLEIGGLLTGKQGSPFAGDIHLCPSSID